MKYSIVRKINLSNIDRNIWPYETEDIGVTDADSIEEALKQMDKILAERMGYYRGIAESKKAELSQKENQQPEPKTPEVVNFHTTPAQGASQTAEIQGQATQPQATEPAKNEDETTNQPPEEFQVEK